MSLACRCLFYFTATATTAIYTLSLHDALPIYVPERIDLIIAKMTAKLPKYRYQTCDELIKDLESLGLASEVLSFVPRQDRKSTRLNSSHANISYAVFCLKKKNNDIISYQNQTL